MDTPGTWGAHEGCGIAGSEGGSKARAKELVCFLPRNLALDEVDADTGADKILRKFFSRTLWCIVLLEGALVRDFFVSLISYKINLFCIRKHSMFLDRPSDFAVVDLSEKTAFMHVCFVIRVEESRVLSLC